MLKDNYLKIIENINDACLKSKRNPEEIELVAVTKTVTADRINEAIDLGIAHIGENRVQEFLQKREDIKSVNVKYSIIGHLQSNKVKYIIDKVDLIQSLDSVKLASEIDRQAAKHGKIMDCLVEINIANESSKFGVSEEDVEKLIIELSNFKNINVKGLMAIPPICEDEYTQRKYFEKLYKVFIDIKDKKIDNINMELLSMGMSGDYYYAILEGSNMIRIGTALFGKR